MPEGRPKILLSKPKTWFANQGVQLCNRLNRKAEIVTRDVG